MQQKSGRVRGGGIDSEMWCERMVYVALIAIELI
jgi:hypothetical protein